MKLYFGIITTMLAFTIIAGGFIMVVIRYQKRLSLQKQLMLKIDAEYKQELLQISIDSAEANSQQIAKDVHDEIGSIFSTLAISVNRFNDGSVTDAEHIAGSRNLIQLGIDSVRRITHAIVPFELELLGLEQTLEQHFETMQDLSGMSVVFENEAPLEQLSKPACLAVYRIIQELSSNCLKHAGASHMAVHMKEVDKSILIRYKDNGKGSSVHTDKINKGIGMKNIESRALLLHGIVQFTSSPGEGFACTVSIPLLNNSIV